MKNAPLLIVFNCIIFGVYLIFQNPLNASNTVLEDDFESGFNTSLWEQRVANGQNFSQNGQGSSVSVANGVLTMAQNATDAGGAIVSKPFDVQAGKALVIVKRTRLHYANDYYRASTALIRDDNNAWHTLIQYYHYFYNTQANFFAINSYDTGVKQSPIWDEWFEEVIVYNPANGKTAYSVNDSDAVVYEGEPYDSDSQLRIYMSGYGWYTGHSHEVDYIAVEWVDLDETLVFEDNFSSGFNPALWEQRVANGQNFSQNGQGSTVSVANGVLTLAQNSVDFGGAVVSKPFAVQDGKILLITKRTRLHYANDYYRASTALIRDDNNAWPTLIQYYHYFYNTQANFFAINSFDTGVKQSPVWDEWFDEEIAYNPANGKTAYSVNGREAVVYEGNPYDSDSPLRIYMSGYGWYTGHSHEVDSIRVEWIDDNTVTGLFADAYDLGGGWLYYDWWGSFYDFQNGWVYHLDNGALFCLGDNVSSLFVYDYGLGEWVWTGSGSYPWAYLFGPKEGWILGFPDMYQSPDRWFFHSPTGSFVYEANF